MIVIEIVTSVGVVIIIAGHLRVAAAAAESILMRWPMSQPARRRQAAGCHDFVQSARPAPTSAQVSGRGRDLEAPYLLWPTAGGGGLSAHIQRLLVRHIYDREASEVLFGLGVGAIGEDRGTTGSIHAEHGR